MAISYIKKAYKNKIQKNFNCKHNFYINPRNRVIPAMDSTGTSYIKNTDGATNFRGTYRLQTAITTSLYYVYTMSQRFIVEGWFKPEFAYDIAGNQTIFQCGDAAEFSIIYNATTDKFDMIQSTGTTISSIAFTSTTDLQNWFYIRAWYDNTAKLAGMYLLRNTDEVYCDTQNVPGSGVFSPLNTISFFYNVPLESSYWIIHELDEALTTGQYKTYQADRQIMFDFNGTTLGRERIRIPRSSTSTDLRGVKSFSISKSVENNGGAGANTASLVLYNIKGQFSDDQYDAFDPFNGYYNGTINQKYLQNRVPVEIESEYEVQGTPLYPSATLYPSASLYPNGKLGTSTIEPLFVGRTIPGSFKRNSPNRYEGTVTLSIEDYVSELGETRLSRSYAYNNSTLSYTISNPADETLSLMHLLSRLVTRHEIKNYCFNSSGENATPANSWTVSGAGMTLSRSGAVAQFGTYSLKCISTGAGDYIRQVVKFETNDKVDKNDTFNFSAFIYQGLSSTVKIQIEELTSAGALIGSASETSCGTDTGVLTKVNVTRIIQSSLCTQLRITFYSLGASTFYIDGIMLIRGIDPLDYFLNNSTDGSSGTGSADNAATTPYDTIAIDTETVSLSHPYAIVKKGETVWEHIKEIADATICRYIGMTADGVLKYETYYNEVDPSTIGAIEDVSSISTSLDTNDYNSIFVEGIIIDKTENNTPVLFTLDTGAVKTTGGSGLLHPITNGDYLKIGGASKIEAKYNDPGET